MINIDAVYVDSFKAVRKKLDNTYQIKVKVRVPAINFQRDFPVEYIAEGSRYQLSLSDEGWHNLSKSNRKIITKSKFKYEECIRHLLANDIAVTTAKINHYYKQNVFDFTRDVQVDKLRGLLSYEMPEEKVDDLFTDDEVLEMAKEIEIGAEEVLDAEDVGRHMLEANEKINLRRKVEETKIIKDPLERCDAQYSISDFPDFTKIIDTFGYYWCLKQMNGERYLKSPFDNKIILRITSYIFTTSASNNIADLDKEWIKNYFFHLRDYGYIDTRKVNDYTPLELYDFKNIILEKSGNRKPYVESSYQDQLKKFKRYFKLLKSETKYFDKIPKFDIEIFNLKSLKLAGTEFSEIVTQKDHYVNVKELKKLSKHTSKHHDLNRTRDLFFIQVFSSGNRSIDKDIVLFNKKDGVEYIEVTHSKTKSTNISGMFKPLRRILDMHVGKLPEISMKASDYNSNLKALAKEIGLTREIEFVFNRMNSKTTTYDSKPLHTCISQYFSRHTLVSYLVDAGIPDNEIIEITGHISVEVLKHYKKKNTVKRKQKIIDKADKQHEW